MYRVATCLPLALIIVFGWSLDVVAQERQLAHMVFFKVADQPEDAQEKLAAACQKYLSGHEGTVHFSVGLRAESMQREVNDTTFDVSLHLVFKNKAAHDLYAEHPRHLQFIEEHSQLWSEVRVFDSLIVASDPKDRPQPKLQRRKLKKAPKLEFKKLDLQGTSQKVKALPQAKSVEKVEKQE